MPVSSLISILSVFRSICPPPLVTVQLVVGYKDNYRCVIEMQVDHSGLWDVSGAWEVLIWSSETVREELASSVCLDAQDSTHTSVRRDVHCSVHERVWGRWVWVFCMWTCDCAPEDRSKQDQDFEELPGCWPIMSLAWSGTLGVEECTDVLWESALFELGTQRRNPNPDTWASDYRLIPHLDLGAQNTKGGMKSLAWWGGDQKSNTLVIPQCWLWFIGCVGLQMSFTVDFGTKMFAVRGWFV